MVVDGSERDSNKNGSCKTIRFKRVEPPRQDNQEDSSNINLIEECDMSAYTCSLIDHTQIGRHYLVKSSSHPKTLGGPAPDGVFDESKHGIKRHYTECFAMRQDVYDSIIKIGRDFTNCDAEVSALKQAIRKFNQETLCISIKNYYQFHGLSE